MTPNKALHLTACSGQERGCFSYFRASVESCDVLCRRQVSWYIEWYQFRCAGEIAGEQAATTAWRRSIPSTHGLGESRRHRVAPTTSYQRRRSRSGSCLTIRPVPLRSTPLLPDRAVPPSTCSVGIDRAATTAPAAWTTDGSLHTRPFTFVHTTDGYATLHDRLAAAQHPPESTLIVMDATGP